STFDYSGSGVVSTSTLLTLNGVTQSTVTLVDVTYGSSRANGTNYNYTIAGSSTGLYWINTQYSGTLTGDSHEQNDSGNHIQWSADIPPSNPLITGVFVSSLTVTWGSVSSNNGYRLEASTEAWPNSDGGNVAATTAGGGSTSLTLVSLNPNTTY